MRIAAALVNSRNLLPKSLVLYQGIFFKAVYHVQPRLKKVLQIT